MLIAAAILFALLVFAPAAAPADAPVYDIPRLSGVVIDGKADDWNDPFRLDVLAPDASQVKSAADFRPIVRLGWDERGLLVLVAVEDDRFDENTSDSLWAKDCIELFVADRVGGMSPTQIFITPGLAEGVDAPQVKAVGRNHEAMKVEMARTRTAGGYLVEARLPLDGIGVAPAIGATLGFQVYVSDSDGATRYRTQWAPGAETWNDARNMHALRLAETASPPVRAIASADWDTDLLGVEARVVAVGEFAGRVVRVAPAESTSPPLTATHGLAVARWSLRPPAGGAPTLRFALDGAALAPVALPEIALRRARMLADEAFAMDGAVFIGEALPRVRMARPLEVEAQIGAYTIETAYYDAEHRPVTEATRPGRYGAVARVVGERGSFTRFITLYRLPENPSWREPPIKGQYLLNPALGIPPQAIAAQSRAFDGFVDEQIDAGRLRTDDAAVVFAGLHENAAGDASFYASPEVRDRQWWVTLKRRLNGNAERYSAAFTAPAPIEGAPAPVLRDGSPAEAGMSPEGVRAIEAALEQWAADSDEAFSVVVARRGVIVVNRSLGTRDGAPMAADTTSWMASTTKLVLGVAATMAVDQGLIDPDAPIEAYLPEMRGAARSATVRQLLYMIAGTSDHWGDERNDLEHVFALMYPHLRIGERFEYNGTSLALAGKAIEQVSGEALPLFYQRRLFAPLGMEHTEAMTGSWDARSTALDMARLGQMLLNRGAYGQLRFFGEASFETMLPVPLAPLVRTPTDDVRGFGCHFWGGGPMGPRTFGHGAASSATFRVDPDNDLVVTMTRNAAGRDFETHHAKFLQAVMDAIEGEKVIAGAGQ